jgi:hypothetical protein
MVYRVPIAAPVSQIPEERRGRVLGRFCHTCSSVYPLHRGKHVGKPAYGRDHVASPCAHEGDLFEPGADWWENAVDVLPEPAAPAAPASPEVAKAS